MKSVYKYVINRGYTNFVKNMVKEMKIKSNKKIKFNPAALPLPSIPTIAYFQVIGNGVRGSPKCVHLFTNFNRYLFNVGEGTQRLVIEHKCKLSKLSGIFVTHSSWANMGGLPGVMLCLKDIGIDKVVLHGPPKVENLFIMTKGFMQTEQIEIEKYDYTKRTYEDGCIKIRYVPMIKDLDDPAKLIAASQESNPSSTSASETESDSEINRHPADAVSSSPKDTQETLRSRTKYDLTKKAKVFRPGGRDIIISYIGELYAKPGALDYQKCMEFKVPPNSRLLGNLKAGQDAILDDGTVVKSSDVVGPEEAALHFAVVECPTMEYISNFTTNESFSAFHLDAVNVNKMKLIVHFTPHEVMETPIYKNWMAKFGPSTSHLVVNESNGGNLSYIDALEFQAKLNLLDPDIYPLGHLTGSSDSITQNLGPKSEPKIECDSGCGPIYSGTTLAKFNLRPACHNPYDISEARSFEGVEFSVQNIENPLYNDKNDESLGKDLKEGEVMAIVSNTNPDTNSAFAEQRKSLQSTLKGLKSSLQTSCNSTPYPQFIFLGTGSAVPNKTRNVSAIWVNLDADTSILLDCGEGSFGQAARFFGLLQEPGLYQGRNLLLDHMLRSLKCVFISHLHADHHLGLISVINERRLAFQRHEKANDGGNDERHRKLVLVGPKGLATFLRPYNYKHQEILSELEFIHSYRLMPDTYDQHAFNILKTHLGIQEFVVVPVYHFKNPTGLVLRHKGKRIVYSGDTLPCDNLIKYGQLADVLIHEATMEDDLESEGFKKRHSTISQALDVGKKMNAKFTLLTHFSQRYSKIPLINENHESFATLKNAGIAFDNMKVDMENMRFLPCFIPVLKTLFADETLEMEERTNKLIHRKRMAVE